MARQKSKKYNNRTQRDYQYNPKISDLLNPVRYFRTNDFYREKKQEDILHDKRRFRPEIHKAFYPNTVDGIQANVRLSDRSLEKGFYGREVLRFKSPKKVIVCRRRWNRRLALFASGKAGKGKKVSKFRKFTEDSLISCKRR